MKQLLICIFSLIVLSGFSQQRNPIIPGYHPDPSVCRVGNDYYLVNSSFQYFPGVPVYHSVDLENWALIGNVLDRQSQLPLDGATSWLGIYAPTLRYHNGTYYMITTNVGKGGNFMVTSKNPAGPWSEPIWLNQQGIDPSLYFEGKKCYMVSNPDNMITLCEIDPMTGKQLTESKGIWQGTGGRYPEGPHIYKKDGYYYLLISEGGTELAHRLTIARSKNIYGPYEANPQNPLFTHCSLLGQNSTIQGTGHGDLVQKADGSWWLVLLAYRNFGGSYHHLGRETFLAPVSWPKGAWPVVNNGQPIDTLNASLHKHIRTTFDRPLGPEWIYIQNPDSTKYALKGGHLRLYGSIMDLYENKRPTFIGRRQEAADFVAETKMVLFDAENGDEAGLCVYQINDGFAQLNLANKRGDYRVQMRVRLKSNSFVKAEKSVGAATEVWMRVASDGKYYYFWYSVDGKKFQKLEQIECSMLSTEVVGGFTGAVVGMYAFMRNTRYPAGYSYADFEYFDYKEN